MNTVRVRSNTANTGAGNSANIWYDCPFMEIIQDPGVGYGFTDDFLSGGIITSPTTEASLNGGLAYSGFGSAGSTITYDGALGGGIVFTEATADQSVAMKGEQHVFNITQNGGKLWFEARVKTSTITANEQNFFVGLMDTLPLIVGVPLAVGGAFADTMNVVGFRRPEADTTTFNAEYKANTVTAVEVNSAIGTLAADTYIKLGMRFNPDENGSAVLSFYVNGVRQASTKTIPDATGTDFPADVQMAPCIAMILGNSAAETMTMDWWSCYQLRV